MREADTHSAAPPPVPDGWLSKVDTARLVACFEGAATHEVVEAMRRHPRFTARLEGLLRDRFHLDAVEAAAGSDAEADRAALELDREGLEALAQRCGLVTWSAALAQEIRRPVVAELMDRFGEPEFRAAVAERDLALDARPIGSVDQLALDVARDGNACLAAWIAVLPLDHRRRIALRWPADAEMPIDRDNRFATLGPAILRRVLAARERTRPV